MIWSQSGNKISSKLSTWNLIIINMEFIATTRGERQLLNDHYYYNKNKTGDSGNIYWECVDRRSDNGCGQHSHPPNTKLTAVEKIRANMKRDARNADPTIKCIVSANTAGEN